MSSSDEPEQSLTLYEELQTACQSKISETITLQSVEGPSPLPHRRIPLGRMAEDTIRPFLGLKDGEEDAMEFLEDLDFKVTKYHYTSVDQSEVALRVTFQNNLQEDAYMWYRSQPKDTKQSWTLLKAAFVREYVLNAPAAPVPKPFEYFDLMYNLKQGDKDIVAYTAEAEQIHKQCPSNLQEYLGRQFVAGLADKSKFDMVHILLDDDESFTFLEAKAAVVRAYRRIGQPNPFGGSAKIAKHTPPPPPEVTQAQVNAKMLSLIEAMEAKTKAQDIQQRMEQPSPQPPPYRPPPQRQF